MQDEGEKEKEKRSVGFTGRPESRERRFTHKEQHERGDGEQMNWF